MKDEKEYNSLLSHPSSLILHPSSKLCAEALFKQFLYAVVHPCDLFISKRATLASVRDPEGERAKAFLHLFAFVHVEDPDRRDLAYAEPGDRTFNLAPQDLVGHERRNVPRGRRESGKRAVTHRVSFQREQLLKLNFGDINRLSELVQRGHARMQATKPCQLFPFSAQHSRLSRMEVFYTGALNCKAGYVQARKHGLYRAFQVVEIYLTARRASRPMLRPRSSQTRAARAPAGARPPPRR